jgi:hypothetical protein
MRGEKGSISLEKFALILVDLKFEYIDPVTEFNRLSDLSKGIETRDDKSSNARFLEYVIFDLFTDYSCFVSALSKEVSRMLFETYFMNILVRLAGKGHKVDDLQEFEALFNQRATEYHQYLQEFDPEYIKKIDINKHPHSLGKAFSMNFLGYEHPAIFFQADHIFVSKLSTMVKYLKEVAERYKVILPK